MTKRILIWSGLIILALIMLSIGCQSPVSPEEQPPQSIAPPEKMVGSFALWDEAGTISLSFPSSKGLSPSRATAKTIYNITGELIIGTDNLTIIGTYNDSDGSVAAEAEGMVGGLPTKYIIQGKYDPATGFVGEISRTRDSETVTGSVGMVGGDETLEIWVFLGTYDMHIKATVTPRDEEAPPLGPYENDIDPLGTFCVTCSENFIIGVYRNDPDYDDDSGGFYGLFTDTTTNPDQWEFEIRQPGEVSAFGIGTIDKNAWTVSGTWQNEWDDDAVYINGYWYDVHIEQDGLFDGVKANN